MHTHADNGLSLDWKRPLQLTDISATTNLIYTFRDETIPERPGLYVFGRTHGKRFEALYVGKAKDLKARAKQQLGNLELMRHVQNAKTGQRFIIIGEFKARQGQQVDRCLPILERALIRHFLSDGHDLANLQGTIIRRHEIKNSGSKHMPDSMYVDRGKRE